jgi:hypothetical protein
MKAQDLRIGNYVNISKKVNQMQLVNFVEIHYTENFENYEPIPLTEEWLLKFGFVKLDKSHFKIIQKDIFKSPFTITLDENEIFTFAFQGFWYQLEFLHQLQNLYYCLCCEELEIKIAER